MASVPGSQTVGTAAALADWVFSDHVAKHDVDSAFTYITVFHLILSLEM